MGHHREQTSGNKTASISASRAGLATPPSAGVRPARVPKQPRGKYMLVQSGLVKPNAAKLPSLAVAATRNALLSTKQIREVFGVKLPTKGFTIRKFGSVGSIR